MKVLTGLHSIEEYLKGLRDRSVAGAPPKLSYSRESERIARLVALAREYRVPLDRVADEELDSRFGKTGHRGVVLEVSGDTFDSSTLESFLASNDSPSALVLLLDGVTDPHNLGAILRSADQFGVDLVVLPSRRSAKLNETVMSTSAGSAPRVPLATVVNLTRSIQSLQSSRFWVYGADTAGDSIAETQLSGRIGLVVGSEGAGLSRLVRESCDFLVRIPTFGSIDSLNVSVASGMSDSSSSCSCSPDGELGAIWLKFAPRTWYLFA